MYLRLRTQRSGQSLIEIVVAMGMVVFFGAAFVTLVSTNYGRLEQSRDQSHATLLGQEAINVIRAKASTKFDDLVPSIYGLDHQTSDLIPSGDTTQTGADADATVFNRTIEISVLNRDEHGNPTQNNQTGTPDPASRFVRVSVAWENKYKSGTIQMFTIVSSWNKGGSVIFDTQADFSNAGSEYHTTQAVDEVFNGEVRASQVGGLESPAVIGLTPEVTLDPTAKNYGIELSGDELFSVNETALNIYSVSNISSQLAPGRTATLMKTLPVTLGRALAMSDTYIFVGTANDAGEVQVYDRSTLTEVSWDLPGAGDVTDLSYDKETSELLVTRIVNGVSEKNFYAISVPKTIQEIQGISVSSLVQIEQRIGNESLNHITSDGKFAYIGTGTDRVIAICLWSGCGFTPRTIITFNPSNAPIRAVAVSKNILYIGRVVNASEPELMAFQANWNIPQTTVNLNPAGSAELGTSVNSITTDTELDRVLVATARNASNMDDVIVLTAGLQKISGIKMNAGGGTNCIDAAYEGGRLFASCALSGKHSLFMVEDSVGKSVYAPYASYTSPATCVSPDMKKWDLLSFNESGLGYVDIQLRVADTAADLVNQPWLGAGPSSNMVMNSAFTDDTIWHYIGGLAAKPCIQARVHFHATAFCPLYLETLIFTYE